MTATEPNIETMGAWSAWRKVDTGKGVPMMLRTFANPTEDFWTIWRSHKDWLKANGLSCGRNYKDVSIWEVKQWKQMPPEYLEQLNQNIQASQATDTEKEIPVPEGLQYFGFQKAGIAFCRGKHGILIADEMGLGKTVQAIGMINDDESIQRVLVVCPASLKLNWYREVRRWLTRKDMQCWIAEPKSFPKAEIVICNYDILSRFPSQLSREFDLVIADECHWVKNQKSLRAKSLFAIPARRRLGLSGTPIVNRPQELFAIVNWLNPVEYGNYWRFVTRYCGASKGSFGLTYAPNDDGLHALHTKLRSTIMVRRLKKDVLKDLPAKIRSVIEIDAPEVRHLIEEESDMSAGKSQRIEKLQAAIELAKVSDDEGAYRKAIEELSDEISVAFTEMAGLRAQMARAKIPYIIEHLEQFIEAGTKVVAFGHHRDLIDAVHAKYKDVAVKHYGGMSDQQKQESVDRFQRDPNVLLFMGSIKASGVGLTLTEASNVVLCEEDWVPGNIQQVEDRCHRIGQANSVTVQHLVIKDSLDAYMAKTCVEKLNVIDKALDSDREQLRVEPMAPRVFKPSQGQSGSHVSVRRSEVAEQASRITPAEIALLRQGLQIVAGVCDGAHQLDMQGFNGCDAHIGKSLAAQGFLSPRQAVLAKKLLRKYRRQMPEGLYQQIYGSE